MATNIANIATISGYKTASTEVYGMAGTARFSNIGRVPSYFIFYCNSWRTKVCGFKTPFDSGCACPNSDNRYYSSVTASLDGTTLVISTITDFYFSGTFSLIYW